MIDLIDYMHFYRRLTIVSILRRHCCKHSFVLPSYQLKTDDKGVAHWGICPFTVGDKGVCSSPLNDAVVS